MPGMTYLVGERGPELFTSTVPGVVTPNHALTSSGVVINQYNDFSGVDEASVYSRIIPALKQTKDSAVAEVRTLRREGRL